MTAPLALPAAPELKTELTALQKAANAIEVSDAASYGHAAHFLRSVKTFKDRVGQVFDPICEAAHKAHKAATSQRKAFLDPADDAERTAKGKMSAWFTAEQRRKADEARREAERLRREEEDRKLSEAAALEAAGEPELAEQVIEQPIAVPVVIAAPAAPKMVGVTMREKWEFEIVDKTKIPMTYLIVDESAVRRTVEALHERAQDAIPGIRVTKRMVPAASGF